jgi:hypothetical protein
MSSSRSSASLSSSSPPPLATVRRLALATRPSPVLAVFYSLASDPHSAAGGAGAAGGSAATTRVHRIDLAAHLFAAPDAAAAALVRGLDASELWSLRNWFTRRMIELIAFVFFLYFCFGTPLCRPCASPSISNAPTFSPAI